MNFPGCPSEICTSHTSMDGCVSLNVCVHVPLYVLTASAQFRYSIHPASLRHHSCCVVCRRLYLHASRLLTPLLPNSRSHHYHTHLEPIARIARVFRGEILPSTSHFAIAHRRQRQAAASSRLVGNRLPVCGGVCFVFVRSRTVCVLTDCAAHVVAMGYWVLYAP